MKPKRLELIPEAKKAGKMWAVRLSILSAVLGALEVTLHLWKPLVPIGVFAALSSFVGVSAAVARVIKQNNLRDEPHSRRPPRHESGMPYE